MDIKTQINTVKWGLMLINIESVNIVDAFVDEMTTQCLF